MGQDSDAGIRISYAERDEAVSTLGVHLSTGRLELAEYEERCGRAAAARTRGDLEELFADLPAPHPDLSSATRPANLVQKTGQLVSNPRRANKELTATKASSVFEVLAGMCVILGVPGAILLTVFLGQWWVFIPVGMMLIVCGALSEATRKNGRGRR